MEKEGIICGYHTMIDWEKTSVEKVTALIEVRVTPQRGQGFDNIAERIYKYPEVNSVYLISGGYDLLVTLDGKSLKEVSAFVSDKLSALDTVLSTATHFILKKYKDHGTILAKKYEDESCGLAQFLLWPSQYTYPLSPPLWCRPHGYCGIAAPCPDCP